MNGFGDGQWRLFFDLFKVSLKVVLPHSGNKHPVITVASRAVDTKETCTTIYG
jgi:hypothetical protein